MDDKMNLDTRLQLLESAVARLHREMHELQIAIKSVRSAGGGGGAGAQVSNGTTIPSLPKFASQWLLTLTTAVSRAPGRRCSTSAGSQEAAERATGAATPRSARTRRAGRERASQVGA